MRQAAQKATLAPDPESKEGTVAVLAVAAGKETYGVPLSSVREILVPPPVTDVPRAPEPVLGVITVRGQILTLVDLAALLDLERTSTSCGRVLLVERGGETMGLAVDRVLQVYRMEPGQIEYASAMRAELSDYVVGIGRVSTSEESAEADMVILIDPRALLGRLR